MAAVQVKEPRTKKEISIGNCNMGAFDRVQNTDMQVKMVVLFLFFSLSHKSRKNFNNSI